MINGIINIYKEEGYTSHDVVAKLRGIVKQKKIGHTGTLDPDAVGVLPVCFGNATKLCDMITDKSKEYEASMILGIATDTQDISGRVLMEKSVNVSEEEVFQVINSFVGKYNQIPPMYSAIKINGKKLYELAREGKEVERKPRPVEITSIQITYCELPEVRFIVGCSKGTYIRTLCHDIGEKLGCGATMRSLKRTRVGNFHIENSITLAQVEKLVATGELMKQVVPSDEVFMDCPKAVIRKEFAKALANGNKLLTKQLIMENEVKEQGKWVRIYDENDRFTGIYEYDVREKCLKPFKMFFES